MSDAPALTRYSRTAIALHWVLAPAWIAMFVMGVYMADLPFSPWRLKLYNWHKWAGMAVLCMSCARLWWRLRVPPPPLPDHIRQSMPGWQHAVHQGSLWAFYALFLLVPLLGWAYSSAAGFQVVWFGVLPLPNWVPVDRALADVLKLLHQVAAFGLAGLVLLHVAAALKHAWVDRDGLLARMGIGRS